MIIELDKHGGIAVYRQIVDQLRRQVVSRQLPAGAQLPSVRDLAAQLRINPMTVSKAYGILDREGLVERRAGVGVFVAPGGNARKQDRLAMLERTLSKAAAEARLLDVSEQDALLLLSRIFRRLER